VNAPGGQRFVGNLWRPILFVSLCLGTGNCRAQQLTPRTYIVTPIHTNAIILTYSFDVGDIVLSPTLPVSNTNGKLSIAVFSYFHTFSFFGRSANITGSIPYTVGRFNGDVNSVTQEVYRSGLSDLSFRFSFNLKGGPAMDVKQFVSWKQKLIVGASLTVTAPTGQYDPTRLANTGTNRWAIKPEIGLSRRWGKWVLDAYGGVWFFTENPEYFSHNETFPGTNTHSQNPLGVVETHLSYDFNRRLWVSGDANFLCGGSTGINHIGSPGTYLANSRIGATASLPLGDHQSLKVSYSYGAIVRVGGRYHDFSVGWQFSWLGRPK
jgi:hypothetical protein